jgi:hypothetical protein
MSAARWLLHCCHPDDLVSFVFWNEWFAASTRSITAKNIHPLLDEPPTPEPNRIYAHLEPYRNPIVGPTVRRQQYDMRPPNLSQRTRRRSHDPLEALSFFFRQDYHRRLPHNHSLLRRDYNIITDNYGGLH